MYFQDNTAGGDYCKECLQDSHCQVWMSNLSSVIKICSAFNMPSANLVFLCNVLPIILPLSWSWQPDEYCKCAGELVVMKHANYDKLTLDTQTHIVNVLISIARKCSTLDGCHSPCNRHARTCAWQLALWWQTNEHCDGNTDTCKSCGSLESYQRFKVCLQQD